MEQKRTGLSLRYKLLIVLTVLPLLTLSLYLLMATKEFERDKMAYVYDSSVAVSRSLATQIRAEMESLLSRIKPIVEGFDFQMAQFSQSSNDLFLKEQKVEALLLFSIDEKGQYKRLGMLSKAEGESEKFVQDTGYIEQLKNLAAQKGLVVQQFPKTNRHLVLAYRLGNVEDPNKLIFISLYRADEIVQSFTKNILYSSFLLDDEGRVNFGPSDLKATPLSGEDFKVFFSPVLKSQRPEGTEEILTQTKQSTIVSYYDTGIGGTKVASVVSKKAALKAVDVLISKSLLFFLALLSCTVIISVFASIQLTSTLRELYEATKKIAQGNFDIRIRSRSRDEVGGLAESFNWMAGEVSRLLSETAEKVRLENELATVRVVQETLFPLEQAKFGAFNIFGHFEPATECGGDWWSYSKVGNKVFFWIGDATGHGAPAALMTSAARSAAVIIESLPDMGPARALEIMNRAIYETSKARIMMTFFLGVLDIDTGKFTYANASHDPPYLIRLKEDRTIAKKDLVPLMEKVGSRLGEKPDSKYEQIEIQLEPGDSIFCYTDGIIDVQNKDGKSWGERSFLKSLIRCSQEGVTADEKMMGIKKEIEEYRGGTPLIDDVTMFMCHYERSA